MSRHQAGLRRLSSLGELHSILSSMKTLAMLETHKLTHFQSAQARVVETLETMAGDFLQHYPEQLPPADLHHHCYVLLGSERGFCGDFNEAILEYFETVIAQSSTHENLLVTVGHRLNTRLASDPRVQAQLPGPSVAEEIEPLLPELLTILTRLQHCHHGCAIHVILQSGQGRQVTQLEVIPPFQHLSNTGARSRPPPLLNLSPSVFFEQLVHQYLFAVLHACFYTSLSAENHRRMEHLEGATQHLERKTEKLRLHYQYLRQEEITEEIEEILLGAESLRPAG